MKSGYLFSTVICVVVLGIAMPVSAAAISKNEARTFVQNLTEKTLEDVVKIDKPEAEKISAFRKIFTEAVDLETIGQFILGRHWRAAPEGTREEFLKTFKDMTVYSWAGRFNDYAGEKLEITETRPASRESQIFVHSRVKNGEAEPIEVIWRLAKKNDGRVRIIDLVVAGASMVRTYKNEYAQVIRSNGGRLPPLVEALQKKVARLKNESGETILSGDSPLSAGRKRATLP